MKFISPLFLAGVAATFLSGCYMDRTPTMTLEDRLYADEATLKSLDAVKLRRPTLDEYAATAGIAPRADAFDLKLRAGENYRVYVVLKSRDAGTGVCRVELLQRSVIHDTRKDCALIVSHLGKFGINLVGATTDAVVNCDSDACAAYLVSTRRASGAGMTEDTRMLGATLPPVGDAVRRFVVRHIAFAEVESSQPVSEYEIECLVIPADKPFDADKESAALQSAILADWKKTAPGA